MIKADFPKIDCQYWFNNYSWEDFSSMRGMISKMKNKQYSDSHVSKDDITVIINQKTTKKVQIINSIEMQPINFEDALNQLKRDELVIPTLGGKSKLKIKVENNLIFITNSKNNQLRIDKTHWDKVMDRLRNLPQDERGMTSRYGVGKNTYNWKECPNQVFSIYIPAIVKYLYK